MNSSFTAGSFSQNLGLTYSAVGNRSNPQHYSQLQKDSQIVAVVGTDNVIAVSFPALAPNFSNIYSQLSQGTLDCYYQLKSFHCINDFDNVNPEDQLEFTTGVTYYDTDDITASTDLPAPLYSHAVNEFGTSSVSILPTGWSSTNLSANEAAHRLNEMLRFIAGQVIAEVAVATENNAVLTHLSDLGSFVLTSNELVFNYDPGLNEVEPGAVRHSALLPALAGAAGFAAIGGFVLRVQTPEGYGEARAKRLAHIFGMRKYLVTGYYYIDFVMDSTVGLNELKMHRLSTHPGHYYRGPFPALSSGVTLHEGLENDVILIHSSLYTNIWNREGSKKDVIAIVPVYCGVGEPVVLEKSGEGRIFDVRDSLNSLKNFVIYFTNNVGEPIAFRHNYFLELAIFFQPRDPSVVQV